MFIINRVREEKKKTLRWYRFARSITEFLKLCAAFDESFAQFSRTSTTTEKELIWPFRRLTFKPETSSLLKLKIYRSQAYSGRHRILQLFLYI